MLHVTWMSVLSRRHPHSCLLLEGFILCRSDFHKFHILSPDLPILLTGQGNLSRMEAQGPAPQGDFPLPFGGTCAFPFFLVCPNSFIPDNKQVEAVKLPPRSLDSSIGDNLFFMRNPQCWGDSPLQTCPLQGTLKLTLTRPSST